MLLVLLLCGTLLYYIFVHVMFALQHSCLSHHNTNMILTRDVLMCLCKYTLPECTNEISSATSLSVTTPKRTAPR